jgi:adenylosuccinate synthase
VTGRKRRCGWFDAVLVRQSCSVSGVTGIALTKLDVLDGLDEIKICTGLPLRGETLGHLPATPPTRRRSSLSTRRWKAGSNRPRRAQLGAASRPGDQVHPPRRGTDRLPGRFGIDEPGREDTILVRRPFAD